MAVKSNYENPLSNLSYINKDFQTIYPELLDLAKKISYKWDPSISDESDPGVVLLKLCAIIADKNNFNIDNSTLEYFPETVSQEYNARPLFAQVGYFMKWFRSATTEVSFKWIGPKKDQNDVKLTGSYTIPRFTMLSNYDSTVVYTLLDEIALPVTGNVVTGNAIEGTITDYIMNGETLITPSDLDADNRLYFSNYNVAENGIFISNYGVSNYNDWRKVDNLSVEEYGNKIYKFGVSREGNYCYIEFPDDVEDLMGVGITIKYILSSGVNGNIGVNVIEQFYSDITVPDLADPSSSITLNTDNVQIGNLAETLNGRDVETITDAYKNYKKTIGTFNTLVSTRDYENYIKRLEKVSNCVVADRITDIQNSYHIMSDVNNVDKRVLQIDTYVDTVEIDGGNEAKGILPFKYNEVEDDPEDDIEEAAIDRGEEEDLPEDIERAQLTYGGNYYDIYYDKMQAYDLKLYALRWTDITNNHLYYNSSFTILPYTESFAGIPMNSPNRLIDDIVDPEYGELANVKCIQHNFKYHEPGKICLLKNKYPIRIKIIPQYKLTDLQRQSVEDNITTALYNALNAKEVEFGEQINYDYVFDTIVNSDERIKSIALDIIEYTTYAVYFDLYTKSYKEVAISDNFADDYITGQYDESAPEKFILDDPTQEFTDKNFYIDVHTLSEDGEGEGKLGYYANTVYYYDKNTKTCQFYSDKINSFRQEIYAKSVLNGNTQLLIPDERFLFGLNQNAVNILKYVEKVTTNVDINVQNSEDKTTEVIFEAHGLNLVGTIQENNLVEGILKLQYLINDNTTLCPIICGNLIEDKKYELINSLTGSVVGNVEFNKEVNLTTQNTIITFVPFDGDAPQTWSQIISEASSEPVIENVNVDKILRSQFENPSDHQMYDVRIQHDNNGVIEYGYANITSSGTIVYNVVAGDILNYNILTYSCQYSTASDLTVSTPGLYTLRKNESIILTSPNLIDVDTYANYVKYQFQIHKEQGYAYTAENLTDNISNINYDVSHWNDSLPNGYYKFALENANATTCNVFYKKYSDEEFTLFDVNVDLLSANKYNLAISNIVYKPDIDRTKKVEFTLHIYQGDITIPANTIYELKDNESITFYWRDSDDADYNYRKYTKGTKICASFVLSSKYNSDNIMVINKDGSQLGYSQFYVGGELEGGGIVPRVTKPFYLNKTPVYYTYNEYIATLIKERYVLSGNRSIAIKDINEVNVDAESNRCYWILNETNDNDQFVLFENGQTEYTLKSGEYFVYPNRGNTALILLSSGTKLIRTKIRSDATLPMWAVDPVDYDDIVSEGINGIDKWFDIPTAFTVTAREMQYYALNDGTTLRLTPNNNVTCSKVLFNNKGYTIVGDTTSQVTLADFTIEYKEENAATFTNISTLDTSDATWDAYSVYSLDVANNHTQSILSNQSIIFYTNGSEDPALTVVGNDELPIYMETSQSVVKDGGENIPVYITKTGGEKEFIDFYLYNIYNKNSEGGEVTKVYYQGDYTTIQVNTEENSDEYINFETVPIQCKLPVGNYIIPFKHASSSLENVYVLYNNVAMKAYNFTTTNFEAPGVYYLILNVTDDSNGTLVVKGEIKAGESAKLILDKIFKYNKSYNLTKNDINLSEGDYNRVFDKLRALDVKNRYKYTYVVDDDEKIENPLAADSFLDNNHICNKFTICQMNTETTDIYITNRIK